MPCDTSAPLPNSPKSPCYFDAIGSLLWFGQVTVCLAVFLVRWGKLLFWCVAVLSRWFCKAFQVCSFHCCLIEQNYPWKRRRRTFKYNEVMQMFFLANELGCQKLKATTATNFKVEIVAPVSSVKFSPSSAGLQAKLSNRVHNGIVQHSGCTEKANFD